MAYIYRIVLDSKEDVYRDILIDELKTLEDLHNAIVSAFTIEQKQMASFYKSNNDWEQGEEYTLFETEKSRYAFLMSGGILKEITACKGSKLLYVFDFFLMWTFFVELVDIQEYKGNTSYKIVHSVGELPKEATMPDFKFSNINASEVETIELPNKDDYIP